MAKAYPGQPIRIAATDYNSWNDAADDFRQRQHTQGAGNQPKDLQTSVILILNDSGDARQRFDVLCISGSVLEPKDDEMSFLQRVCLKGDTPSSAEAGRFVILLEPLADGAIGRACAQGVTFCLVEMNDEGHRFADVLDGSCFKLSSGASGMATLLWVEPLADRGDDPTVAWCVVRLGGGGGSATQPWGLVVSKTGSVAPFRYVVEGATMDEDGVWTGGGQTYENVFSRDEMGATGYAPNPLVAGEPVELTPAPGGASAWIAKRVNYRGTY